MRALGIAAALSAALLFGAGTPVSKLLLAQTDPWLMASFLYLGSGIGLWLFRAMRGKPSADLASGEWKWLAAAIVSGGVVAPVLLMTGLAAMPASGAALLLNAEGVFTALLAWFVFKENFDKRIALGMLAIVAGAVVLSWPGDGMVKFESLWPTLAVLGACLAWAADNNFTRMVALADASWIAMVKGLTAGATNLVLAFCVGAAWPGADFAFGAASIGFLSYGVSLSLFVVALRHLGTARTSAYFSVAPFFGAVLALGLFREPLTMALAVGGGLMAIGVVLHLFERHAHVHHHEPLAHTHDHRHGRDDPHHDHLHADAPQTLTSHRHFHQHPKTSHSHAHFPDAHHHHRH